MIEMTEEGHFSARIGKKGYGPDVNFPSKPYIFLFLRMIF